VPTVEPLTSINYTLSLPTDPLTGPFTTTLNTTAGLNTTIRVYQMTAGPQSTVVVSFGDGSANQTVSSLMIGQPQNVSHIYTTSGTFTISATATTAGTTGVNTTLNQMTAYVAPAPVYSCKIKILF
jgi:hypothetical protein